MDRHDAHVLGQPGLVQFNDSFVNCVQNFGRILSSTHEHDALHRAVLLVLSINVENSSLRQSAHFDAADVLDEDWHAFLGI